jgi:hypothetical protein
MEAGFAIHSNVVGAGEIDALCVELGAATLARSRAGARHLLNVPAVAALARDPRLVDLAASALGGRPIPFGATLFDKSVESNWLVVWHQDTALPLAERRDAPGWGPWSQKNGVTYAHAPASALAQVVALRIHLDDSHVDSGPLRVLPATHTLGVLTDEAVHALTQRVEPVTCTVDRGGVVVMRPLLVHASSKVNSPVSRRVIHVEYAASAGFDNGIHLRAA